MLASSSRREMAATTEKSRQAKKVGCMSGIFYFLHFHRHNSRKRLPSPAGRRDSKTTVSPAPAPALPSQPEPKPNTAAEPGQKIPHKKRAARQQVTSPSVATKSPGDKSSNSKRSEPHEAAPPVAAAGPGGKTSHNKRAAPPEVAAPDVAAKFAEKTSHNKRAAAPETAAALPAAGHSPDVGLSRRLSCDVPRSPTIPSEIRLSNSPGNAARKPPALVARLMGLDDPPPPVDTPESAAEKRRKLLGALERCDEDLRALKNIIEALRVSESQKMLTPGLAVDRGAPATPKRSDAGYAGAVEDKRCLDVDGEQPSPVSVLDALSSPPARRRLNNVNGSATMAKGGNQRGEAALPPAVRSKQQPCPMFVPPRQPGRHDEEARVVDGQISLLQRNANLEALPRGGTAVPAAGRRAGRPFLEYYSEPWQQTGTRSHPWQRLPCSRAMEESVEQVWEDGVWEERWELGRVGVAMEADILGALVAEIVKELGFRRCRRLPLPFDACRKRLFY